MRSSLLTAWGFLLLSSLSGTAAALWHLQGSAALYAKAVCLALPALLAARWAVRRFGQEAVGLALPGPGFWQKTAGLLPLLAIALSQLFAGLRTPHLPTALGCLLLAAAVAFGEEFVFRGVIYHLWAQSSRPAACWVSALLFGALHLANDPHSLLQAAFAVAYGLALAGVVRRTGSIWPGVAAHVLHNLCAFAAYEVFPMAVLLWCVILAGYAWFLLGRT